MYHSFYMNEKMLIDNWNYYDDCNWLLTNTLCKDNRKTIEEKLDFYFENRHERKDSQWYTFDDTNKLFLEDYQEYCYRRDMYEDFIEYGGEDNEIMALPYFHWNKFFEDYEAGKVNRNEDKNREAVFRRKTSECIHKGIKLREINEVIIYKSDLDAITVAKKKYNLTELQTQICFGLIFMSRLHDSEWCRINTEFKLKSFKGCFNKTIKNSDLKTIIKTKLFIKDTEGKETDYKYLNFDNKDEVAYTFHTTLENNKLNLSALAKEAIPDYQVKYCTICRCGFSPNSNRQKMCEECKKEVQKKQARLRKQKQRAKSSFNVTH